MNYKFASIAAAIVSLSLVSPCMAQNIKQQEMIARDKEKVATLATEANAACGTQIKFSVDYPSYENVLDDENNQSPWAYLANATDALKSVCRSDAGKQAVAAKIKSVTVSHGETEEESVENGVFHYTVPYSGHSPSTVVDWLTTNL